MQRSKTTLTANWENHVMPDDRLPLTPESVKGFVQRLHSDPQLKSDVVSAVNSGGSIAMIQKFFAPTDKQLKTLTAHANSTKAGQQLLDSAIVGALMLIPLDVAHHSGMISPTVPI